MFKALELIPKSKNMDSIAISGIYYEMGFLRISDKHLYFKAFLATHVSIMCKKHLKLK